MKDRNIKSRCFFICLFLCLGFNQSVSAISPVSGEFELTDYNGSAVNNESFNGQIKLIFFGFTTCHHVCPLTMLQVNNAMKLLNDEAVKVQFIFISVDRENDSPAVIEKYVTGFNSSFVGLSGTELQLQEATGAFNVKYDIQEPESSANGKRKVFHSPYLYIMDRDGQFLDVIGFGAQADEIAQKLYQYLD